MHKRLVYGLTTEGCRCGCLEANRNDKAADGVLACEKTKDSVEL